MSTMRIPNLGEPTWLKITSITPASYQARNFMLASLDESMKILSSKDESKKETFIRG
jgi:hypothetical protein